MTYKSISDRDPWPDKCPEITDLTREELICFLEDASTAPVTEWERGFCLSLIDRLVWKEELTDRQQEVLARIFPVLYNNDPALWGSYALMLLDITVDFDKVSLAGSVVPKPNNVSASDWLQFWEALSEHDPHYADNLSQELTAARKEIEDLSAEVARLTARIEELYGKKVKDGKEK